MEHWSKVNGGRDKYKNIELYKAMREYGKENFMIELLDTYESHKEALEGEIKYINQYNTFFETGHGYNMTLGGFGALGTRHTTDYIERMKEINIGPKNPMYGKKWSPETREKMKGRNTPGAYKSWEITCPDGTVLKTKNCKRFCEENNLNYDTAIKYRSLGKDYKGYKFKPI